MKLIVKMLTAIGIVMEAVLELANIIPSILITVSEMIEEKDENNR